MVAPAPNAPAGDRSVLEALIAPEGTITQKAAVDRLLNEFETAAAAIWGSPARLRRAGVEEAVIDQLGAVRRAITHVLAEPLRERPLLSNWKAVLNYLTADMGFRSVERVRVLYLDTGNALLRDELVSEGTIDEAPVHVRELIRRGLELGAAALVLVHNHPSGSPQPSQADVNLSIAIQSAGRPLGIELHDHLIIAGNQHVSLRTKGLLS